MTGTPLGNLPRFTYNTRRKSTADTAVPESFIGKLSNTEYDGRRTLGTEIHGRGGCCDIGGSHEGGLQERVGRWIGLSEWWWADVCYSLWLLVLISMIQTQVRREEETSMKDLSPSDWPGGVSVGHFLD